MSLPLAADASQPFPFGDLEAMPDDGLARQWCAGELFSLLREACTPDTVVIAAPSTDG